VAGTTLKFPDKKVDKFHPFQSISTASTNLRIIFNQNDKVDLIDLNSVFGKLAYYKIQKEFKILNFI
jgi:hypothetical protein